MSKSVEQVKKRRTGECKLSKNSLQCYLIAALPLLYIFIFSYIPMIGLVIAFKNYRFDKGIFGSEWVGFRNFEFFLKSNEFYRITRNTIGLNFFFIVLGIIAAVALAIVLFSITSRRATKIFQTIMITPHFLSWVVVGYMVYGFLNPQYGILNAVLAYFEVERIDWYSIPNAWPIILAIASVWKHVGMDSVIYYAALMGVDTSLFEAAEIDGASKWQVKKYIVLPSLIPIISIMTILKIGNIFRADFGLFYQLTRDVGSLYVTTDVIDTYVFRTMREVGDMGMSSAAGLLQSVVGFITVVITNHISKKIDSDNALF